MSQQGSQEGDEAVFIDFQSVLESLGDDVWEAVEGLSLDPISPMDEGPTAEPNLSVLPAGGSDGRPDDVLIDNIKRTNLRRVIVRSIIKCSSNEQCLEISRAIGHSVATNRHSGASSFLALVPHQCSRPHVHVWHDCNPQQGMCRCRLFTEYRGGKEGFLATRKSVKGFKPLRSIPTEEARKEGDPYFKRLLK